jgi:hypothetical protein
MNNLHNIQTQGLSDIVLSWLWWWTTQNPHRVRILPDKSGVEVYFRDSRIWVKRTGKNNLVMITWNNAGMPGPDWSKVE